MSSNAMADWSASWTSSDAAAVQVQTLPDGGGGVASLRSSPLQLTRAEGSSAACEVTLRWTPPLSCLQFKLQVKCSARHVELFAGGVRNNMLGEQEAGEVYLGTFRGTREGGVMKSTDPQTFIMTPSFAHSDKDCSVLQNLQTMKIKFVSLTGDKSVLKLDELQCVFVPVEVDASSMAGMTAKLGGLGLGAGPDVQKILTGFQQTLEREMETKIARAVDAKLALLSQRLAFSEQALFQLHKKMDAKDANMQANLDKIQQKFAQLELQMTQFSAAQGAVKNPGVDTGDTDPQESITITDDKTADKVESQLTDADTISIEDE